MSQISAERSYADETAKGRVNWLAGEDSRIIELAEGYYSAVQFGLGNAGFVITEDGVVVIDSTVSAAGGEAVLAEIRKRTSLPIRYLIYTHGHEDHVGGAAVFKREGATVIAHRNVSRRFERYSRLWDHHLSINALQFQTDGFAGGQPSYVYPDITYDQEYTLEFGGRTFRLVHGKGETDDATIVYIPEDRVVYIGDFIIWTFPNVGNPNKVLRYAREWYETLDRVLAWQPRIIAPGHGPSLTEPEALRDALRDTSDALRFLEEQTILHINQGSPVEKAVADIKLPERLEQSPYLRQVYGTREFVIRGIYRRYTGWYDGNPTHLAPSPEAQVRTAVLDLIGDEAKVLAKAEHLQAEGQHQLALHIVDLLIDDSGQTSKEAVQLKIKLLEELAGRSNNLFYHNFYKGSARQLSARAEG
ncbi:alkyl sulfatase dimerization domain-containing protein [Paenibacillus sp. NFR01]|uniref:alkyl sulfatase dimerization domain-containing protein n=1 Tax=Paenibacillus sp. NFR01 TaxID=1566279 RepID=UPI0008B1C757|nr:alkyl sulfatase dimerization domain-containing protein [Paenibacillus sp. NFR01]SET06856.1 Metallo-beta-lactamase superfamily protein [Paenibacillus sp. NFR01]